MSENDNMIAQRGKQGGKEKRDSRKEWLQTPISDNKLFDGRDLVQKLGVCLKAGGADWQGGQRTEKRKSMLRRRKNVGGGGGGGLEAKKSVQCSL